MSAREKLLAFGVNLLFGSLSTFEYIKVSYEKCFHELPAWHQAHLTNQAVAPLQYRVLSYLIPELLSRLGIPIAICYVVEHEVFLVAAGYVFFLFCRNWLGTVETLFCSTLLMFFYTLSALPHIQPSEELNLFAFALGLSFIRERRFGPFLATVVVATANKETIGFLIPFYVAWEWRQEGSREMGRGPSYPLLARTLALAGGLAVTYLDIRLYLGTNRPYLAGLWQWLYNLALIASDPFVGLIFVIPSIAPAVWIVRQRRRIDPFFVAFLPALGLFVAGHFAISRIDEFRTYTPLALMTIPAALVLFRDSLAPRGWRVDRAWRRGSPLARAKRRA